MSFILLLTSHTADKLLSTTRTAGLRSGSRNFRKGAGPSPSFPFPLLLPFPSFFIPSLKSRAPLTR